MGRQGCKENREKGRKGVSAMRMRIKYMGAAEPRGATKGRRRKLRLKRTTEIYHARKITVSVYGER